MSKATERILSGANEAVRRLNPHVFNPHHVSTSPATVAAKPAAVEKRVRQDSKPLMNKLESEWFNLLKRDPEVNQATLRAQARRYKIANGAWYKPDITAIRNGRETAWECKGPSVMKGVGKGLLTLKVAAAQWPEVEFRLVWKQAGRFHQQIIEP